MYSIEYFDIQHDDEERISCLHFVSGNNGGVLRCIIAASWVVKKRYSKNDTLLWVLNCPRLCGQYKNTPV